MIRVSELKELIASRDAARIAQFIKDHDLSVSDNKICANEELVSAASAFWDKRQLVKKINLNSLENGCVHQ